MSRSKKPRKRYDPTQQIRRQAANCVLYRWTHSEAPEGDFNCHGPYPSDQVIELMEWAMTRQERWLPSAIGCYVTSSGEYYEDMVTFPVLGPLALVDKPEQLFDYFTAGIQEVASSGNSRQLIDAVFSISLYTPRMESNLERDNWLKQQALYRSKAIMAKWRSMGE